MSHPRTATWQTKNLMSEKKGVTRVGTGGFVRRQFRVSITWKKYRNSKGVTENYEGDVKEEIHKTKVAQMLKDLALQIEQREAKDANKVFAHAITVNIYAA